MIIAALESYTSLVVCWMICISVGLSLYLKNSNIYKSSINLPTDILNVAHYGKGYKIPGKIFTFCGYYQLYPNFYLVLEFFYSLLFLCNLIWSQFNVNTQYKYSYFKKNNLPPLEKIPNDSWTIKCFKLLLPKIDKNSELIC